MMIFFLYEANKSTNLGLPYETYKQFHLDDMEDDECVAEFRVQKCVLSLLYDALRIPDAFRCEQRSAVDGMEGLCMLLKRLT